MKKPIISQERMQLLEKYYDSAINGSPGTIVANSITINMLKKLPGAILTKINQKVGFRLLTKHGEKEL